jgi:hypothetical protein
MAFLLLNASPGDIVSMELLEDVAVQTPTGLVHASQTKSVRTTNPISDSSASLWKTFANWSRSVRQGTLDASKTTFEIYINKKLSGPLATEFDLVNTKAAAQEAFENARRKFWGDSPKFLKKVKVAETLRPHLDEVFGAGAQAFQSILPKFQLTFASATPEMDLHNYVAKSPAIAAHAVEDLICHLHGWIKAKVDAQVALGTSPVISYDAFLHELRAFYSRLCPTAGLPDPIPKPSVKEILELLPYKFVEQLKIIQAEQATVERAMHCFFKSAAARTLWSDRSLIHDESITEFEESLKQAFRNFKNDVFTDPLRTDENLRGQLLLGKCDQYHCKLEEKEVPTYFTPGCFHALADKKEIGWHPRYLELLTS